MLYCMYPLNKEKEMKTIKLLSLLLCVLLLLPLCTSCVWERHKLLTEIEQNGKTFCVRGNDERVKQIVVKENGKAIWSKSIQADKKMGKIDDNYGVSVQDLNFDGHDDIVVATKKNGECVTNECYLYVGGDKVYQLHEELSSMYTVRANAELEAIFTFEQSTDYREEGYFITCDKTTKYKWKDGELVPDNYAAIYHSSENVRKPYRYALAFYDSDLKDFLDSDDLWLTEEEYQAQDWSFLYYFK